MIEFTPQSRELRLHSGETDDVETLLLHVQRGGTTELIHGIVAVELTRDKGFAEGVRALGAILVQKLMLDGNIVTTDIRDAEEAVFETDLLGE